MSRNLAALGIGFLFAIGLGLSGMTHPSKVIGFLDVFGQWDPTMVFVIGGAVCTFGVLWAVIKRRPTPLLATEFQVPTNRTLDAKLLVGSAIFGVGWGMGGFCPGPALVVLPAVAEEITIFLGAMIVGMVLHILAVKIWDKRGLAREDA